MEKGVALSHEQPGVGEESRRCRGSGQRGRSRANDRAERQVSADEFAWPRHDEAGRRRRILIEIREHEAVAAVHGWSVPGFIIPDFEMSDFGSADAGDDSKRQQAAAFQA